MLSLGAGPAHCPLLSETVANIGDIQVRNLGTIGGSAAHADPAADYPAAFFALEAQFKLVQEGRRTGRRARQTSSSTCSPPSLEPGEIVAESLFPWSKAGAGVSYQKCVQPASGYAIVGVAARVSHRLRPHRRHGPGGKGLPRSCRRKRVYAATQRCRKGRSAVAEGVDANSDIHASRNLPQAPRRRSTRNGRSQQAASRMA